MSIKKAEMRDTTIGVKIRYADGSVIQINRAIDNFAEEWIKAPSSGVQVISIYDGVKRAEGYYAQHLAGQDYYWYSPTEGFGQCDMPSFIPADALIKTGKEIGNDAFRAIYNEALNDREF